MNEPQAQSSAEPSKKLSYKEQRALESKKRELAELPQRIETLEAEVHVLTAAMTDSSFYQQDSSEITATVDKLNQLHDELAHAYHRWEELDKLQD